MLSIAHGGTLDHGENSISIERDPQTGLPTGQGGAFLAELAHRVQSRPMGAPPSKGAIALVDLDYLTEINERRGYLVGDQVILEFATRLQAVAPEATIARIGGDDFVLMFEERAPDEVATMLLDARCAVRGPMATDTGPVDVTFSGGVTSMGADPDQAMGRAFRALFQAKDSGRDQVRVYSEDTVSFAEGRRALLNRIDHLQRLVERMSTEARTDSLTGLPNRRGMDEEAHRADRIRARRPRTDSILFLDLDKFGLLNHRRGQEAGDDALRRVAEVLKATSRPEDMPFRRGGEEFVVLLPDTPIEKAGVVAERIRVSVEGLGIAHGGAPLTPILTVTVVAAAVEPEERTEDSIERAAEVAFAAKGAGRRNRVHLAQRD
ncbi:MAG: GGDEF domain-containing protein [Candidatus Nanopelagicales bacterium]